MSTDNGDTWTRAQILDGDKEQSKWSWALWQAEVRIEKGPKRRVLSRACDADGNIQNDNEGKWNLRGVAYDGYGDSRDLEVL